MPIKQLDLLVCLKLAVSDQASWTYAQLAESLEISASEANASVKRSLAAGLLVPSIDPASKPGPMRKNLLEFIKHGIRYCFFEAPGPNRRGIFTAHSAGPLSEHIESSETDPLVWPDPEGSARGQAFAPLYRSAPAAARKDPRLYEVLALVDAIRGGRTRERQLAFGLLQERLS